MPETRILLRWAALVAVSAALAYGLSRAHFPAAFLLGPMLAAIAFGVRGAGLSLGRPLFLAAQAVIGCLVARSATTEIAATLREDGLIILAVVGVTVAAGALTGLALTRLRVLPGTTAAWGSSPGGAAAMVAMAEDYGADPRLVAFMQYVRVAAVVLSASLAARLLADVAGPAGAGASGETWNWPGLAATIAVAAAGFGLASLLRLPSAPLIGPMLLGAGLHAAGFIDIALPAPVLDAAYAAIGWYVGLRFNRRTLDETLHALPGVLTATIGIILLCGVWAWVLTHWLPIDFLTAFLATSPGGLDSVAIIAVGSRADVSFVLAVQTLRLFVVLATGPILAKWIARAVPGERP
ncbi:UNVERIFIED_ORG: membrane AbrB-like protein [Methylobacterium sp. SuP10 SLI 274]|uniref:AbrB family transcriptional regulator n=1 Tax=Methylorubrum extorquens TaxID=408 RepID=UPI00209E1465|nr:AbrB family transcriptional regulator [Methylorubrum extorquens]MDF9864542.1 membrane AbrB-like protein [Methylorubrum pseudosasae]MDH6638131.1 membrane AbrB-like protein [Methylobacterium sp. SuP10 SLI 274]MDH6667312.1 membrane AbrB-like protein [Methylorubrum zatmanii]MCP1559214.1 membrane AbrB-like protein [Methylorubrum extorquens]MDF9792855.1 membrane AbrB-like protein [Methylorubrum extorquens]